MDEDTIMCLVCKRCGSRGCKGEVNNKDCINCYDVKPIPTVWGDKFRELINTKEYNLTRIVAEFGIYVQHEELQLGIRWKNKED